MIKFLVPAVLAFIPHSAQAWGGRGHHTICEAAVFLVENEELKDFLRSRGHVMGHLCNVPDTQWRGIAKEQTQEGNPSHFLDSELLGTPLKDITTDYSQLLTQFAGKKTPEGKEIQSIPHEFGSVWWRADQFYRQAILGADILKTATPDFKIEKKDEQNEALPYNKAVFSFYVNLGLMGHFVADNSMPFHVTNDYDGYDKGHGGIHGYYEDAIVSQFDESLLAKIVQEARKLKSSVRPETFLVKGSVVQKMKSLSLVTYAEIDKILKADALIKPSEVKDEDGKKIRTPAVRDPATKNFKKFEKLAITDLARAVALLASLWDQAYEDVGKPNLKAYKSYKYPVSPEFLLPDYYPIKDNK